MMRSPNRGYELRRLEGESYEIWERGDRLVQLGEQMDSTADTLSTIGDSSIHRSKGTEKLAEMASETAADLAAAATRYDLTGRTLRTYAAALGMAQGWIHPRIDDIEAAELAYQAAQEARADAVSAHDRLESVLPWEDKPTDQQRASTDADMSQANTALTLAQENRDELWEQFETRFSTWSDAYDDAMDGIQNAMDTAGNNDGFWEFIDNALDVIAVVLLVLTVLALVIGAPIAGLLGAIMLGLAALVLALNLLKFAFGRATLSDVAWAAVGLLPFGLGRVLSRGAPTLSAVMRTSRGAITQSVRSSLPAFRLHRWSTWGTPWNWLRAPAHARGAAPHPGVFVNPFRTMANGGPQMQQMERFVTGLRTSQWSELAGVRQTAALVDAARPTVAQAAVNIGSWSTFFAVDVADITGVRPDIPLLTEVRVP
ncbi:hypothetical protein OVN18_03500 [Microcella daejeonensis]|uniref:Uncharacterized protein n=1 Tax=Microcella daejeonensis TaxID=2994971 RepID=A0A9E8SC07_9MICO|nr:hypothetical protein [Microcella daejeonensis]WAB82087.1 hypothetical protein OVN18_03500 [Microcella daejeonensis]